MGSKENTFIEKMVKSCGDTFRNANLLTSVAIAQSIQESGWGTSQLSQTRPKGGGNNYHGLNWYNDEVTKEYAHLEVMCTQERNGKIIHQVENFCKFKNSKESFKCLKDWYTMREKYKCLIGEKDYRVFCNYLTGRYATDSKYGERLIAIIEKYNLTKYDFKLTATSYKDYSAKDNKYYRVRKSFDDEKTAKGSFKVWSYAFNCWNVNKANGYHVYDAEGRQLD